MQLCVALLCYCKDTTVSVPWGGIAYTRVPMRVMRLAFVAISNSHTHITIIIGPNAALVAHICVVTYVSQVACSVNGRTL